MKYVAFFRGINVGGKNIVKMADLRKLLIDCHFSEVRTYIQSGNVLFKSDLDPSDVIDKISQAFEAHFGFHSQVVLRSADEISKILKSLPFTNGELEQAESANTEVEHVYVFLSQEPVDSADIASLNHAYQGEDRLVAGDREIYLLCHQSVRDSKLASSISKLQVSLTARNQKTLHKIFVMMNEEDG